MTLRESICGKQRKHSIVYSFVMEFKCLISQMCPTRVQRLRFRAMNRRLLAVAAVSQPSRSETRRCQKRSQNMTIHSAIRPVISISNVSASFSTLPHPSHRFQFLASPQHFTLAREVLFLF